MRPLLAPDALTTSFDLDGSEGLDGIKIRNINPYKNFISSVDYGAILLLLAYKTDLPPAEGTRWQSCVKLTDLT